ncbi:MAG: fumarate hydratase [Deltaproteobacteria bacterium]|uniref:Fumarate hydratase n=1 Tax=Candidatus Zymogenus saltonus TaxID=2844893 RepID=A0A9D8KG87_9DELT|nr:fumarate hydratase [Candidatus Zymogenus saltonus]
MRSLSYDTVVGAVRELVVSANRNLPEDVIRAVKKAREIEESPRGVEVLDEIIENARIAKERGLPLCQDTGTAVFFVERGEEVTVTGPGLERAIFEGVRLGYTEGNLRKSTAHPLTRENVGDNTPPTIHITIVHGDKLKLSFLAKGGGAENMSRLFMLSPSEGEEGLIGSVVETVEKGGAKACPPLIVGVGLGGTFDTAPILAKGALLREVGSANMDKKIAEMEGKILKEINKLGIGPMGYGGRVTALAVHIELRPCHIASLPVAVNLQCHSARHGEVEL